ncbi:MAG: HAMP domain-containing sensor histidine kinase [Ancrocorticia sp.]
MTPKFRPRTTSTLSFRLVYTFVMLMIIVVTAVSSIAVTIYQRYLVQSIDDALTVSGRVVAVQIIDDLRRSGDSSNDNIMLSDYYINAVLQEQAGQTYIGKERIAPQVLEQYGTPANPDQLLTTLDKTPRTVQGTIPGEQWRVIVLPIAERNLLDLKQTIGAVIIARPLSPVLDAVALMTRLLLFVGLSVVAVGTVVTWLTVRHHLRPLRRIEHATHAIAAGDLSRRVPTGQEGSEVSMLADSINVMLAQIEHAFADKERSETKMRQFISDASHELRTPLATVRGYAELYRLGGVPQEQITPTMGRIESEARRMSRLVEDLLQLARLDEGQSLQRDEVNITAVCSNALSDMHARDLTREPTLISLDGGKADDVVIMADKDKVTQVVTNLLGNVLTHTPPGTPTEIAVGMGAPNEAIIEIRDHGPGVRMEDAEHLFERFYRTDSSRSRASGGSGLGMAIVAAIMAAHGGTARVAPTEGGGLTVRLTFPTGITPETPPPAPEAPAKPAARGLRVPSKGRKTE